MEIVEKILEIDRILKERKEKNKLKDYNSGQLKHLKQIEFHKCNKKNRWVFGGNRTGKTECGAENTGKFCSNCGKPKHEGFTCAKCGYTGTGAAPKFCPNCGNAF